MERIVEDKDATDDERAITEINAGLYAIDAAWLRRRIGDLRPSPATGELYLTDLVRFAREDGRLVAALDVDDDGRLTGINDRAQLARAEWDMRVEVNDRWMRAGVTMTDPSTVYLDHGVELAQDVVLEPNVILRGATTIGERTRIAAGSQIVDTVIGADCVVWASVIERSTVEDQVTIGPFAHLRPGAHVGGARRSATSRRSRTAASASTSASTTTATWATRTSGADTNVGAGHHHRQLRRRPQAPDDDRRGRLPRRRHDAGRAGDPGRGREDRRRRRGHAGTSRRASSPWASPPGSARPAAETATGTRTPPGEPARRRDPVPGRPHAARGLLRGGRDRPGVDPPQPRRAAGGRGPARRASGPAPASASRAASSRSASSGSRSSASWRRRSPRSAWPTGCRGSSRARAWTPAPRDGVALADRDHPARAVHDRVRGARAQDARARPPGAVRPRPRPRRSTCSAASSRPWWRPSPGSPAP